MTHMENHRFAEQNKINIEQIVEFNQKEIKMQLDQNIKMGLKTQTLQNEMFKGLKEDSIGAIS